MNFGLSEKHISIIKNEVDKNLGYSLNPKLYIFGSRVKGGYRDYSDIDLVLKADNYDEKSISKIDFEKLDISYKVDFVLEKNLFKTYRSEILSHMVLF